MKIIIGLTGASGSIYAEVLTETLLKLGHTVHLIPTAMGRKVFEYELDKAFDAYSADLKAQYPKFVVEDNDNLFAGVASGSNPYDAVVVCPCSMGTLGAVANGLSQNLLTRVCDVAIKEKRRLVLVPRETPLSTIHLENLLKLSKCGVSIVPAMPGFYHKPQTLEEAVHFMVGKLLDHMGIENNEFEKWKD